MTRRPPLQGTTRGRTDPGALADLHALATPRALPAPRALRPLVTLSLAAALLALPSAAYGSNTRVVVAGPENDPIAARLQKELTALGYEPVRVDDAAACAGGSVTAWMAEMHASGAACSDGKSVVVYTASPSAGVRVADVVEPHAGDDSAPDVVALRAAEVARASIELAPAAADAAPAPATSQPTWSSAVPPQVDAGLRDRKGPAPPRFTPPVTASGGMSALMGADATAPALDLEMELRVYRHLALAAHGAIPLSSTHVTTSASSIKISPGFFGVGPIVPLASSDSVFIPRVGGGVGVVWLNAQTVFTNAVGPGTFQGISTTPTQDDIVSPAAYLNAAMSMRVAGPIRLVLDGLLGTTAHRMVVRADGQHLAYWGQPFGALALRGEAMFR
jgi:hypothetical protein